MATSGTHVPQPNLAQVVGLSSGGRGLALWRFARAAA